MESYSSSEEGKRPNANPQLPLKPKKLLYTGLACVATLAAGNNIYQSAKAHHSRRRQVEEGVMSVEEEKKLVSQGRMRDIISLGVAAVGAYNVRNGWRRAESHWQADAASKR